VISSGAFLVALSAGYPVLASALIGGACYVGYRMTIGTDVNPEDIWKDLDKLTAQRVMEQIDKARRNMKEIREINKQIPAKDLSDKLNILEEKGNKIVELLINEPKDVKRATRFIDVYLAGAVSVSRKFADVQQHLNDEDIHRQYHDFLEEMIDTFGKQHAALLDDDVLDLDVEIEVLQKRMRVE